MLMSFPRPSGEPETFFSPAPFLFPNAPDMAGVLVFLYRFFSRWIVIAFVQAQMLWFRFGGLGSVYDNRFQALIQQFRVWHIGTRHDHRQWTSIALCQNALFRAVFRSIRGWGPT